MGSIEYRIEQRYRLTDVMRDDHLHRTAVGCYRIGEVEHMQGEVGRGRTPAPPWLGGQAKVSLGFEPYG